MLFKTKLLSPFVIGTLAGSIAYRQSCPSSSSPPALPPIAPINNTQEPQGPAFLGQAAPANPLPMVFPGNPDISSIHGNGANTDSLDRIGPLGNNLRVTSSNQSAVPFWWGNNNEFSTLIVTEQNAAALNVGVAAVDPDTMEVLTTWYPPSNGPSLLVTYGELNIDTNTLVMPGTSGHLFIIQRLTCDNEKPYFRLQEEIDISSSLPTGAELFTVMTDASGNIWFTTGQFTTASANQQTDTIIGYVDGKSREVYQTRFTNQVVENGLAVNGNDVYLVTGPAGTAANATNAIGFAWSLRASAGVQITWKSPYEAGSGFKKNGLSRGSGSTPVLLGDQYIAYTDNANVRINLVVMEQKNGTEVCKVPLFSPNESGNENGLVANLDSDKEWGVVIENTFNWPPYNNTAFAFQVSNWNSDYNDMSQMPGGLTRINVSAKGVCELSWTLDIRTKAPATLSTRSGLVYIYTQDNKLAEDGQYEWYVAAIDFRTGEEKWRVRTGAGGKFNDGALISTLSPEGKLIQGVLGGIAMVKDS